MSRDLFKASGSTLYQSNLSVTEKKSEEKVDEFDKEPLCLKKGLECYDPLFWGPYLSERQWGTVREDCSSDNSCWNYTTYESATKNVNHWGEDGLLGISDRCGILCASVALWNENDPILKERLFGLSGKEGNHGEDVKELYYYLDNTPDHRYMHALYKYPINSFPYEALRENCGTLEDPEYEILDTGVFDNNEYWDIHVEYAKPSNPHLICKYTVINKSSTAARLHIIPQFYFRDTTVETNINPEKAKIKPNFKRSDDSSAEAVYEAGDFHITFHHTDKVAFNELLFSNNETAEEEIEEDLPIKTMVFKSTVSKHTKSAASVNYRRSSQFISPKRDAFHKFIIKHKRHSWREDQSGTKIGAWMVCDVQPHGKACVYWQIIPMSLKQKECKTIKKIEEAIREQKQKAELFYQQVIPKEVTMDQMNLCRQAIAGLLWSKQFYLYNGHEKVHELYKLYGEDYFFTTHGAIKYQWKHLDCADILLMPDKWEFPWFASWDLAIQSVLIAPLDLKFAKKQITILLSDRYMHPNGQIPGCEFDFSDANPPLVAWAVWKIHQYEKPWHLDFIKKVYPRLLINYQWWHKLDPSNCHLFGNGFMGLDNICLFDRSHLPRGVKSLKQADATGWMGQFALNMLQLTLEQCKYDLCLTDMAIRFLTDFFNIAKAINTDINHGGLWHEDDGFYYDLAHLGRYQEVPIRVRSWNGIIPLLACARISLTYAPGVKAYLMQCSKSFAPYVCKLGENDYFFTLVPYIKLKSVLQRVFAEREFLSPFGIRSVSKLYNLIPLNFDVKGQTYTMTFQPGESNSNMFGGNSNWRGPIWLCLNYLFVECMERYSELDQIFTQPLSMEYPSLLPYYSKRKSFLDIVHDLCQRILSIFTPDYNSVRPVHGQKNKYEEPDWQNLVLFYEYFHSENGRGCGASHQTGWSALYLEFIRKFHKFKPGGSKMK